MCVYIYIYIIYIYIYIYMAVGRKPKISVDGPKKNTDGPIRPGPIRPQARSAHGWATKIEFWSFP